MVEIVDILNLDQQNLYFEISKVYDIAWVEKIRVCVNDSILFCVDFDLKNSDWLEKSKFRIWIFYNPTKL